MKNRWVKLIALLVTVILMFTAIGCKRDNDAATGDGVTGSAETYATKSTDGTWGVDSLPNARTYSWYKYQYSNIRGNSRGSKMDAFNEKFVNWPFFSSEDDIVTYAMNSMYYNYGYLSAANQPYVGLGVGWAPAWWEWMSLTHNFSDNGTTKAKWRQYCVNVPCYGPSSGTNNHDPDGRGTGPRANSGYIWSYDTAHWPNMGFNTCGNYHYDNNFCYLITVMNYCMWENSLALLSEVDTDKTIAAESDHHVHEADDASQGMTVGTKFNLALNYVLHRMHGNDGLICIDINCNDGRNLGGWPNNGDRDLSYSCNYWDNVPFGYKDAYSNIYFYQVLVMLQDFCKMGWSPTHSSVQTSITGAMSGTGLTYNMNKVATASACASLATTLKNNINANFWQTTNKRYISCIDNENVYRDYGITYVNTQALTYGIADTRNKAVEVYKWMDGTRTISGDKSKGTSSQKSPITGGNVTRSDIYAYGGYSSGTTLTASCTPRSNTVDFGSWFHTNNGTQSTSGNGIFGGHLENGGAILFTLYYDIMGRLNYYVGSGDNCESAMEKLLYVAKDYAVDELNRDPRNGVSGSNDVIGYVGEYSENGLAPTCYLYGIVGLNVGGGELKLDPHIPSNYTYVGARDIVYGNGTYEFTVFANGKVIVEGKDSMNVKLNMKDWANCGSVIVRIYNEFDQIVKETKVTVSGGRFMADLTNGGAGYSGNTYAVIEKA